MVRALSAAVIILATAPALWAADKPDVEPLIKKLSSKKADERAQAAEAIGKLGDDGKPAARALCQALLDKSPKVREKAGEAMKQVDAKLYKQLDIILSGADTATDPNILDRTKAREAIAKMGRDGSAAYPVLAAQLEVNLRTLLSGVPKIGVPFSMQTEEAAVVLDIQTITAIAPDDTATVKVLTTVSTSPISAENWVVSPEHCRELAP